MANGESICEWVRFAWRETSADAVHRSIQATGFADDQDWL